MENHPEYLPEKSDWTSSMDYDILKSYVGNCFEYKGDYYLAIEDYQNAVLSFSSAESYYEKWPFQLTKMLNNKTLALLGVNQYKLAVQTNKNVIDLAKENDLSLEL